MVAAIRFTCGTCHEKLSVPARHAGRKGLCPNCHAVNRVPAADAAAAATPAALTPKAPAAPRPPAVAPRLESSAPSAPARPVSQTPPAQPPVANPAPVVERPAPPPPPTATSWPTETPAHHAGFLPAWLRRRFGGRGDGDALVPLRREWDVDRGGPPMAVRFALLAAAVAAFAALLWGTIYGLLRLLVPMDE